MRQSAPLGILPIQCDLFATGAYTTARTFKHDSVFEYSFHINRLGMSGAFSRLSNTLPLGNLSRLTRCFLLLFLSDLAISRELQRHAV
jgi:hypothetical protein